jgi:hypothetical protein
MQVSGEDEIDTLLLRAGQDGDWSVVEEVAQRYNRQQDAASVAAECGNVELVRSRLRMSTVSERISLMCASCRGGHLQVMRLCL